MELSSPRLKSIAVTAGFSFWFFIISSAIGIFSFELIIPFIIALATITQIFAKKLSRILDVFAIINTKIFLGIFFIFIISIYGMIFKVMAIDLLRLKKQNNSYWLDTEQQESEAIKKQY